MALLSSKFRMPRLVNVLSRDRLNRLFSNAQERRLICVAAGAGYGKTILAADAVSAGNVPVAWYRLDSRDRDLGVFAACLEAAFYKAFPELCRTGGGENRQDTTGVILPRTRLRRLALCLDRAAPGPAFLVLDDFHLVDHSPDICRAVEQLLETLPENILVIVLSRRETPLRLSRLRAGGHVLDINENDLAFTLEEIGAYYTRPGGIAAAGNQLARIRDKTGGWAAGLALFKYAFQGRTDSEIEDRIAAFSGSHQHVSAYLGENYFDAQPLRIREFMLKANLLPEIDATRCREIFSVPDAKEILDRLVRHHLLVFPACGGADTFYFHHLLRDFLSEKIKQVFSGAQIRQLHRDIATALEDEDPFSAMDHAVRAGDYEAAARMIEVNEIKFFLRGNLLFAEQCIRNIPERIRAERPQLLFFQAQMLTYYGRPGKAMEKLRSALKLFRSRGAVEKEVKCVVDLGSLYYFTGHVAEAKLLMEQVLQKVDDTSTTYMIAMTYLIFLSSVLGEFKTARTYTRQAKETILAYPEFEGQVGMILIRTSQAYFHYIRGDFSLSRDVNQKLLKSATELDVEACLPLVYYQNAATCAKEFEFSRGLEFARQGLKVCEDMALNDSKKAWVFLAGAENCLGLGRTGEAREFIDRGSALFEAPGNRWGLANAWELAARVCLAENEIPSAKAYIEDAFDLIRGRGLVLTRGILENTMARIMILEKNYAGALEQLGRARQPLAQAAFHLFENSLLYARATAGSGRISEAVEYMDKALNLSKQKNYGRFLEEEMAWIREIPGLGTLLPENPEGAGAGLIPGQMAVTLLGQFRICINGCALDLSQCKSTHALTIFKYLAAHSRAGFIPREVLIELIWPEQDLGKTGKRFNMAMSSLRRLLEPDLPPRAPSAYILRKKDTYCLDRSGRISIDIREFDRLADTARTLEKDDPEAAADLRIKAEALYQGPFLGEDLYQEWCIPIREALQAEHLRNLRAIADFFESRQDHPAAIGYTRKILAVDPYDGSAYKKMMRLCGAAGNTAHIAETWQTYQENMASMDWPVDPEIKSLFERLVRT